MCDMKILKKNAIQIGVCIGVAFCFGLFDSYLCSNGLQHFLSNFWSIYLGNTLFVGLQAIFAIVLVQIIWKFILREQKKSMRHFMYAIIGILIIGGISDTMCCIQTYNPSWSFPIRYVVYERIIVWLLITLCVCGIPELILFLIDLFRLET